MPCFLADGGGQRALLLFALSQLPSARDNPYAQKALFWGGTFFLFFFLRFIYERESMHE